MLPSPYIVMGLQVLILYALFRLNRKVDMTAKKFTDVEQLLSDVNDATNRVAERIDTQVQEIKKLRDAVAAGQPVTQDQLDAIVTVLEADKARLIAMGATPDSIPTVPVV